VNAAQKTYWHLQHLGRRPTDYEIASSNLLYHPARGFEVAVSVADWYARHQQGSPLRCGDWERFQDPRETTYALYAELQQRKEVFVDGLLAAIDGTEYDARLSPAWVALLARVIAPLRYPVHGLQMVAAYVGSMAPSGRIAIASLFQAADEIRRVQRLAYRMRQLRETHPGFGDDSAARWRADPAWQPLREVVEKLLVTYDWGEAFVALNLVLKPAVDALFMVELSRRARSAGDDVLANVLRSLDEDCAWHRAWSQALAGVALADDARNRGVVQGWSERWEPAVAHAVDALQPILEP
jgi:hypothetical protein